MPADPRPDKRAMLRVALCVLLYVVLATIYLERWPVPDFDEGLAANPALNLIRKGNFGSSAMSGALDMERVTFWILPLHPLLIWVPVRFFGFHLWGVRLLSVVCGFLTLLILYKLARTLGVDRGAASLLVLFIGTDFMFLSIARWGRMESLLCSLYVSLLFFLVRASHIAGGWSYFVPGLLAGASLLTHPLGGLAIPAFLVLSWAGPSLPSGEKLDATSWLRKAAAFALGLILACLPYCVFVLIEGPGEFWRQMVVYQGYCYEKQGFVVGPVANVVRLIEKWSIAPTWWFFLVKVLFLGWLAWPFKSVRRLFVLVLIDFSLLFFAWRSSTYWFYWIPAFYTTLALCASSGKIRSILAEPDHGLARSQRAIAGLVFFGLVGLNLTAVFHEIYRFHAYDISQYFSDLRRISLGQGKSKARVMGDSALLFAFPEEDFRSYLILRSSMDLRQMPWNQALLDVAPDILLVDDIARLGQFPAYQLPPGCLQQFLSRYGTLRGTLRKPTGGPDNLMQIYALDLVAIARDNSQGCAPEEHSPCCPGPQSSALSFEAQHQHVGSTPQPPPAR
ncbi:MAG: glycosyltransferase family 39 protein [Terriglobia bacterium]